MRLGIVVPAEALRRAGIQERNGLDQIRSATYGWRVELFEPARLTELMRTAASASGRPRHERCGFVSACRQNEALQG